jgi:DNA-directed RNA polymerase alpha subunit
MQMKKDEVVSGLVKAANENGVITTIYAVFGKSIMAHIPFSKSACNTDIDELEFSPRASNSLKRGGIFTVREVIDLLESGELIKVRNLGKKTHNEIKTRILAFGYDRLTKDEKRRFWYDMLELNGVA